MPTNKDIYANEEFAHWGNKAGEPLFPQERHFIEKYLTRRSGRVLEAGTGSGRIAFKIEELGFSSIQAFDFVPEMIASARHVADLAGSSVQFEVADAVRLDTFDSGVFDYAVYLQQVVSFIPRDAIPQALAESFRVLRPGGVAIFSFLDFDGRRLNSPLSCLLSIVRLLRGEPRSPQSLTWLRLGNKLNWRFLLADQASTYWFRRDEIVNLLEDVGFQVLEVEQRVGIFIACSKP